jgi:hypothetical protein
MAATTDPNVSFYQTEMANLQSGDPTREYMATLAAGQAPALAQTQVGLAQQEQQLGVLGPSLQLQGDEAGLQAGYDLGNLGINAQQQALNQQGSTQNYQLQQQQFQQQAQQNQVNYQNQLQNLIGGQAASGVQGTTAAQNQQGQLGQQAAFANQTLGRQVQQSAGDYARAQQGFQLAAQSNGISQQEVYTRLQEGLQSMGIQDDPSTLMAQMAGGITSGNQGIAAILSEAGLTLGTNVVSSLGG